MTNDKCIALCRANNLSIAGTEDGFQCFCGDVLLDSTLLDDTHCNMTRDGGGSAGSCGGPWALSLWSTDGKVAQANGPEHQFTLPQPAPGSSEVSVHTGGILFTVVPLTTALDIWPPPVPRVVARALAAGLSTSRANLTDSVAHIADESSADVVSQIKVASSDDLAVAARSPTEPGPPPSYASGAATPGHRLSERVFGGSYRGAMRFMG